MTRGFCIALFAATFLAISPAALAGPADKAPETTKQSTPKVDKPKTDKAAKPKTAKELDAFFKEGERQSEDGPSCRQKPQPVA